jgi:ADP-ribosylglycohydrolase
MSLLSLPPGLPTDHADRLARARLSLDGLSVGDAFGQRFFIRDAAAAVAARALPEGPWPYTDDTEMALGLVGVLESHGRVDQDALAEEFGRRYHANPWRGYGGTAHGILREIHSGMPWRYAAGRVFDGQGSCGNGAAMRAAPLGAYFADDFAAAAEQARLSAEVTHAHPEGQAGAVAVAVAAAWAWTNRDPARRRPADLFDTVLAHTPAGETRDALVRASVLDPDYTVETAVFALGNGSGIVSQDTVPFCLWCAARHLGDYFDAMWTTVSGLGDRDTTCAIVGGIVSLSADRPVPPLWLRRREGLK